MARNKERRLSRNANWLKLRMAAPVPLLVCGYSRARRQAMVESSACAEEGDSPSASLPKSVRKRLSRLAYSGDGTSGLHTSVLPGKRISGPMTPMMSVGLPLMRTVLPMTEGERP